MMDMFHLFIELNFIETYAANDELISFSWTISRFFNVSICLVGVGIFFIKGHLGHRNSILFALTAGTIFIIALSVTIYLLLGLETLPQSLYPDATVVRPLDFYPFLLFFCLRICLCGTL